MADNTATRAAELFSIVAQGISARTRGGGIDLSSAFLLEQALAITVLSEGDAKLIRAALRIAKRADPALVLPLSLVFGLAERVCKGGDTAKPARPRRGA